MGDGMGLAEQGCDHERSRCRIVNSWGESESRAALFNGVTRKIRTSAETGSF
jgi:hypothetical protein